MGFLFNEKLFLGIFYKVIFTSVIYFNRPSLRVYMKVILA